MILAFTMFALVVTGAVEVWQIMVLAPARRPDQRRRHADPPGLLGRDGRARGHRQRGRPQLRDVQRRPRHRAGRRRAHDRRVRHLDRLPDRRDQLPRGPGRPARDARERAADRPADRATRLGPARSAATSARASLRPADARSCCSAIARGRPRRDVRHELPGGDPAAHRAGPPLRRDGLRVPDGGLGPRVAGRGPVHRVLAAVPRRPDRRAARSWSASRRSPWACRARSSSRSC